MLMRWQAESRGSQSALLEKSIISHSLLSIGQHPTALQARSQPRSAPAPPYRSPDEPRALISTVPAQTPPHHPRPHHDRCFVPDFNELLCISEPFSPPCALASTCSLANQGRAPVEKKRKREQKKEEKKKEKEFSQHIYQ